MQAKRIQFGDNGGADLGVGGQANLSLQVPTDPREEVNFHNIWASFGNGYCISSRNQPVAHPL